MKHLQKDNKDSCTRCPRACGVNRQEGQAGYCGVSGKQIYVARAALHMWEEPCISGETGSGAVFFYRMSASLYLLPECSDCLWGDRKSDFSGTTGGDFPGTTGTRGGEY